MKTYAIKDWIRWLKRGGWEDILACSIIGGWFVGVILCIAGVILNDMEVLFGGGCTFIDALIVGMIWGLIESE